MAARVKEPPYTLEILRLAASIPYQETFDHLEAEADHATVSALVLEVDRLLVVVDEHLGVESLIVIEPLGPLGDGLVLYLARLLSRHRRLLLPCGSLQRRHQLCYPLATCA